MAEETKALTSRPKAFSLPAAPELAGFKTELGPIIPVADYEKAAGELKTSKDIGAEQTRQLGRLEKAEQDIGAAQLATQQFKAGAEADIARQTREGAQDIEAGLDTIRQRFPHPQFHPTQENVQSMATLFSLIGLVGTGMGGGGKMSAMNALVSMNGMLKGWQQGRKDLFEREKVEFDKNMARVKAILDDAYRDADRAYKTLAYNREEAQALAGQSAAKLGGQVGKQILEKQGIERYFKFLSELKQDVKETEKLASQERTQAAKDAAAERRQVLRDAAAERRQVMRDNAAEQRARIRDEQRGQGKPLPEKQVAQITGLNSLANDLLKLEKEFKPEYASLGILGFGADLSVEAKRRLASPEGQAAAQWWSKYNRLQAPNRHALFGATLTGNELKNYQSFTAKPSDDPEFVRKQLLDQADYSVGTANERMLSFERSGYRVPETKPTDFLGTYTGQAGAAPTQSAKPMPTGDKLKSYANTHFGGDEQAARNYLSTQGYR
jgi:hypothetical protein